MMIRSAMPLRLRRIGIDTYQDHVVYMHRDCHVCRAEGFAAQTRVEVRTGARTIIATLHVVTNAVLRPDEVALSDAARATLGATDGDSLIVKHAPPLASSSALRSKVYGHPLAASDWSAIINDVAAGRYSDLQLAAFVTACIGDRVSPDEVVSLTRAMVAVGERLHWGKVPIVDKHSVGGLPGNRTTPLVVAIVAAGGLIIPKTSSRAITSPAGTADTMETLAPVELSLTQMRAVVEREGGCLVWGGHARLSPADDVLIRVERPLDLDSDAQLVASVLSKKIAAGSTHVLIDMPVGPTAKVRSPAAAQALGARLIDVGNALGLTVAVELGDGSQPIGRGIGPALEARDVLAVLARSPDAPPDLRARALTLAGRLLELGDASPPGEGIARATTLLDSGAAQERFEAICVAQGGRREPPRSQLQQVVTAARAGRLTAIDNRRLARVAKLAGAPAVAAAGLEVHVRLGDRVESGQPLFTVHADAPGELDYADAYRREQPDLIVLEDAE